MSPERRGGATGFLKETATGFVPAGARTVALTLAFTRVTGGDSDAYADGIALIPG
ncbi:hypothetical protein AB0M39_11995 [Streptomyces sp. NPDC051907]|uniref:hypothetical protein n=1 Tax=Streptomyces sp. NPDC051907 TaxID=3155284 RepID=UPI00343A2066